MSEHDDEIDQDELGPRLGHGLGPDGVPFDVSAFKRTWDGFTPYATVTVVRTSGLTAAKPGARAIVTQAGELIGFVGGGCVRSALIKAASAALSEAKPRLVRTVPKDRLAEVTATGVESYPSSCPSRGEIDFFIEPVVPPPPLVVLGASEIARHVLALARSATLTPVRCMTPHETAGARQVAAAELSQLPGLAGGFILVATQGSGDKSAVHAALASPCPHILFVASRAKAQHIRLALGQDGVAAADIARITAPAGLDIGAAEPGEVAISILAEIVQLRRAGAMRRELGAAPAVRQEPVTLHPLQVVKK